MPKLLILASLILAVSGVATARKIQANEVDQLKTYRTYYRLVEDRGWAHQFTLYVDTPEGRLSCMFLVKEEGTLTSKGCATGIFAAYPPEDPEPLPESIKSQQTKAMELISKEIKKSELTLKVAVYDGYARRLQMHEITPLNNEPASARYVASVKFVLVVTESGQATMEGDWGLGRGFGILCTGFEADPCSSENRFVDYQLPPLLEGSSLISLTRLEDNSISNELRTAWQEFAKQSVVTADAIAEGTYTNPLARLLARQGESKLPQDFNQQLQFNIRGYFDDQNFEETAEEREVRPGFDLSIQVPTSAFAGRRTTTYSYPIEHLKLDLHVKVRPASNLIEYKLSQKGKALFKTSLKYEIDRKDVIEEDGSKAIAMLATEAVKGDPEYAVITLADGAQLIVNLSTLAFTANTFVDPVFGNWILSQKEF